MPDVESVRHLLLASAPREFWLGTGLCLLLAMAALYGALRFLRHKRMIEDLPTARIRSAPQGYIELQGRAELMDGDPIHAPLSMRLCTWYSFTVEQRQKGGGNKGGGTRWTTIERGVSEHLFYLVDATGRCAIDPDGAAVSPTHRNIWYGSSRIPGRYHASDGAWWARALGQLGHPYRYMERRIEPGDDLLAIGEFITHGGAPGTSDRAGAVGDRLREWKRDRDFLLREFDADSDGEIDVSEWAAARARAESDVAAEQRESRGPPPVHVLGRTRNRGLPFMIAAGTEESLTARYRRFALGLFAIAAPLACLVLWAIAVRASAR